MMEARAAEGETLDSVAGGRLRVLQKEKGYRFSIDALLLTHFIGLRPGERALELGTGSGVISLILAGIFREAQIVGIEIQEELAEMARRSVALNGLTDNVEIRCADAGELKTLFPPHSFDAVFANPPYRKINSGRINPQRQKAVARHEILGSLEKFLPPAAFVLKPAGRIYLIYPAVRMAELIDYMRRAGLEPKRLRIVYSKAGTSGEFVLAEGLKGGGAGLEVLPPLCIYDDKGGYTAEMEDIFSKLSFSVPGGR